MKTENERYNSEVLLGRERAFERAVNFFSKPNLSQAEINQLKLLIGYYQVSIEKAKRLKELEIKHFQSEEIIQAREAEIIHLEKAIESLKNLLPKET